MSVSKTNQDKGAVVVCPVCNLTTGVKVGSSRRGGCFIGEKIITCTTGGSTRNFSPEEAAPPGYRFIGKDQIGEFNYEKVDRQTELQTILSGSANYKEEKQEKLDSATELINEFASFNAQRLDLSKIYPEILSSSLIKSALALPIAPECVHQVFIAIAASLIGTKSKIKISDTWSEPCILWTGFVSPPGTRKTPCMSISRRPLVRLQQEALARYQREQKDYEKKVRNWEGMNKAEKKNASMIDVPLKPNLENFYMEDATLDSAIEAHCQEESKTGFIFLFEELAELFNGLDQYKGGKGSDRQKLLRLFGGGDLKVNRKGIEPLVAERSAISITGGIQPAVLEQLMGNGEDSDGLWGRFLWVNAPPISAEHRQQQCSIDSFLYGIYNALRGMEPSEYTFTPEALKLFFRVELALEKLMFESPTPIKQFLSKLVGYTARIALVLHCLDIAAGVIPEDLKTIPVATMERAVVLADFYHRQVKLLYGKTAKGELPSELLRIVELSQEIGYVSVRNICRKNWAKTNVEAYQLLERLVALGVGELSATQKGSWQWRYLESVVIVDTLLTRLNAE